MNQFKPHEPFKTYLYPFSVTLDGYGKAVKVISTKEDVPYIFHALFFEKVDGNNNVLDFDVGVGFPDNYKTLGARARLQYAPQGIRSGAIFGDYEKVNAPFRGGSPVRLTFTNGEVGSTIEGFLYVLEVVDESNAIFNQ